MSESPAIVTGQCDSAFQGVRDALAEVLASGFEVGAALAVYADGRRVVDLWGGYADAARTRPWQRDTIVNLYSVGKAISAICALRLVDAGRLDLDAPVARYWPEFARANKEQMPVRYLLTHQAALPAIARPLPPGTWTRWDAITEALAEQAPWWEPGSELSGLASMRVSAYRNPADFSGTGIVNTRSWRGAEVPSTNGHGTARG